MISPNMLETQIFNLCKVFPLIFGEILRESAPAA